MCLYPRLIKNPKYKNGNVYIPDERVIYVPIGCGDCIECQKKKSNNWKIRLSEEIKNKELKGYFVTLTFSTDELKNIDEKIDIKISGYNRDNAIATKATRLFLERWRKKYKTSLRHWFITELGHGSTEHIHIHGLIWTNEDFENVRNIWSYGFVYPRPHQVKKNYVNMLTINYIIKYVTKKDIQHKNYRSVILTSPGIGSNAKLSEYEINNDIYKSRTGHEMALPIYYRNKIYTESEREKRWLEKLDKNERWIDGQKVKADDIELINQLLKQAQDRCKKKGYNGTDIKWQEKDYENEQRELLRKNRYNKIR